MYPKNKNAYLETVTSIISKELTEASPALTGLTIEQLLGQCSTLSTADELAQFIVLYGEKGVRELDEADAFPAPSLFALLLVHIYAINPRVVPPNVMLKTFLATEESLETLDEIEAVLFLCVLRLMIALKRSQLSFMEGITLDMIENTLSHGDTPVSELYAIANKTLP